METLKFRGQIVTVEDARNMLIELTAALAVADPVLTDSPIGQAIPTVSDPRWYSEIAQGASGTLLCFRDAGLGWRGYFMPWSEVAGLIGLLTKQSSTVAYGNSASITPIGNTKH